MGSSIGDFGRSTAECNLSQFWVNPIPGQESRNNDYLLENGAAVKINNAATLAYKLDRLLRDPARLATLKENARRLGRPQAAFDVARAALEWGREA